MRELFGKHELASDAEWNTRLNDLLRKYLDPEIPQHDFEVRLVNGTDNKWRFSCPLLECNSIITVSICLKNGKVAVDHSNYRRHLKTSHNDLTVTTQLFDETYAENDNEDEEGEYLNVG